MRKCIYLRKTFYKSSTKNYECNYRSNISFHRRVCIGELLCTLPKSTELVVGSNVDLRRPVFMDYSSSAGSVDYHPKFLGYHHTYPIFYFGIHLSFRSPVGNRG